MTRAPVPPRAPRGRVLVVGGDALVSRIGLDASTTPTATNLFDAVGHLTLAPAREPVERIIIGFDEIRDRVADVVNAIHRLDPGVGLVAVIDQGDEDAAAIARASGFDDVIELAPRGTTASVPPLSAVVEVEPPPLPEAPLLPEPPAPATPVADPLVGDELLGDVDLVDAILEDRGPVVETALRVLRQQPGLSGVVFCERAAHAPPGAVDVVLGPRSFGAIHAAGCTAAELASWARWLARWLALEAAHRRLCAWLTPTT